MLTSYYSPMSHTLQISVTMLELGQDLDWDLFIRYYECTNREGKQQSEMPHK